MYAIKKEKLKIKILDRFIRYSWPRKIQSNYFKGADGIFIVYDITYRESFESVETWIEGIKDNIGNSDESRYAIVLIKTN